MSGRTPRTTVLTIDLGSAPRTSNQGPVSEEYVRKLVRQNKSILLAKEKITKDTVLGPRAESIAKSAMRWYGISRLEFPDNCSVGHFVALLNDALDRDKTPSTSA